MRRNSWMGIAMLAASGVLAVAAVAAEPAGLLDGKTFDIEIVNENGVNEGPDQLIFERGTFDSTECRQYGFTKTAYTARSEGDAVTFQVKATSPSEGTTEWKGTVRGDTVSGTMKWTSKSGDVVNYGYTGKLHKGQ